MVYGGSRRSLAGVVAPEERETMRFGIFGSAQAKRGGPDVDSDAGFREFVEYNVGAEALGYDSSFAVRNPSAASPARCCRRLPARRCCTQHAERPGRGGSVVVEAPGYPLRL
jgi:hypothetical protein